MKSKSESLNWLLLDPKDRIEGNFYKISDEQRLHTQNILKKRPGDSLRALAIGESRGKLILEGDLQTGMYFPQEFKEDLELFSENWTFGLPLPRPQTGKKLFHLFGNYGVKRIDFYMPWDRNKEYLTSPVYKTDFERYLKEGMQQTGQIVLPKISFLETNLENADLREFSKIFYFDPKGFPLANGISSKPANSETILFLVGSESGWKANELEKWKKWEAMALRTSIMPLRTEFALAQILWALESL